MPLFTKDFSSVGWHWWEKCHQFYLPRRVCFFFFLDLENTFSFYCRGELEEGENSFFGGLHNREHFYLCFISFKTPLIPPYWNKGLRNGDLTER